MATGLQFLEIRAGVAKGGLGLRALVEGFSGVEVNETGISHDGSILSSRSDATRRPARSDFDILRFIFFCGCRMGAESATAGRKMLSFASRPACRGRPPVTVLTMERGEYRAAFDLAH